jgi:hypothetical protein
VQNIMYQRGYEIQSFPTIIPLHSSEALADTELP